MKARCSMEDWPAEGSDSGQGSDSLKVCWEDEFSSPR